MTKRISCHSLWRMRKSFLFCSELHLQIDIFHRAHIIWIHSEEYETNRHWYWSSLKAKFALKFPLFCIVLNESPQSYESNKKKLITITSRTNHCTLECFYRTNLVITKTEHSVFVLKVSFSPKMSSWSTTTMRRVSSALNPSHSFQYNRFVRDRPQNSTNSSIPRFAVRVIASLITIYFYWFKLSHQPRAGQF